MIRKATLEDIDPILEITRCCAIQMIKNGIYQWDESYPNRSAFKKDIERGELFVLEENNSVIGCIVISTFMDAEYKTVDWVTSNDNNIYIHRLAVNPSQQGKGYAQRLMTYAEDHSRQNGFQSVRLDTFSQNKRNQDFYTQRGYQQLGNVYFPRQSDRPFYCYELVL